MHHKTNLLLDALPDLACRALTSRLTSVELKQHKILFDVGEVVTKLHFPIDAVVSLVMPPASGEGAKVAMTGRDGVVGAAAALNGGVALNRAIVQIGGQSLACDLKDFKVAAQEHMAVLLLTGSHKQALAAQARQSAAYNITHHLEGRLARWLLRASDLRGSHELDLTEDYVAEMLGVLRTSVTVVARTLRQAGMIEYASGCIKITNAPALRHIACECYEAVKPHYDAGLFPKILDLRSKDAKVVRLLRPSTPINIPGGTSLAVSLNVLVRAAIEHAGGEARAAFYIADAKGTKLHHVVGMSESYARRVDGFAIGSQSLACGLAAATRLPVITPDVIGEPRWQPWLSLAKEADYRACWSFPIETPASNILGTFAMYYREPREATPSDLNLAIALSRAAAGIISRSRM